MNHLLMTLIQIPKGVKFVIETWRSYTLHIMFIMNIFLLSLSSKRPNTWLKMHPRLINLLDRQYYRFSIKLFHQILINPTSQILINPKRCIFLCRLITHKVCLIKLLYRWVCHHTLQSHFRNRPIWTFMVISVTLSDIRKLNLCTMYDTSLQTICFESIISKSINELK